MKRNIISYFHKVILKHKLLQLIFWSYSMKENKYEKQKSGRPAGNPAEI